MPPEYWPPHHRQRVLRCSCPPPPWFRPSGRSRRSRGGSCSWAPGHPPPLAPHRPPSVGLYQGLQCLLDLRQHVPHQEGLSLSLSLARSLSLSLSLSRSLSLSLSFFREGRGRRSDLPPGASAPPPKCLAKPGEKTQRWQTGGPEEESVHMQH